MNYTRVKATDAWQAPRIRCVCTAVEAGANEDELGHQLSNLLKQYTRQLRGAGRIRPDANMLTDLGIDALGLFMILDRIGEAFGIDPIALTQQRSELRRFGDLVDRVSRLCRERRGNE